MSIIKRPALFAALLLLILCGGIIKAQNPANLQLPNQQVVPTDETKRATQTIQLKPGFKYGAGSTGSRLTLQISAYPPYVEPGYNEPATNCTFPAPASGLVGETQGNFAVSPTGNAVYNIPIYCSPGTAGMQPHLSISYMSGGPNGIMGLGWNLGGVSAITRTSKNPYFNSKYEGVKLVQADAFALNGSRMILKNGTQGNAGSTYALEIENFADITAQGQQGLGPQSFVVVEKNGTTTEYGTNADARLTSVGGTSVLAWMVSKVTDEFGNYMLYHYTQLNGELVLNSIEYTGNGGMAPYNELVFEYMPKTEKQSFYEGGQEFRKTQLLKSIIAKAGGELVKKYILQYEFNFTTLLSKLTEINKDGSELAPTQFCWKDPYDNSVVQGTQNMALYSSANAAKYNSIKNTIAADLNSDGFSDMVVIDNNNNYEVLINPFVQNYQTNNSNGFTSALTTVNPSADTDSLLNSHVYDSDFDNNQEVYNFFNDVNNPKQYYLQKIATVGVSNTNQIPTVQITQVGSPVVLNNRIDAMAIPSRFYYDKNDYTADGDMDELIIDGENIRLSSAAGNATYSLNPRTMLARPVDFDGDGVLDIAVFEDQVTSLSVKILQYNGSSLSVYYSGSIPFSGNITAKLLRLIGVGDYNGDGKADLAFMSHNKSSLSVCYSTGSTLTAPKSIIEFTPLNAALDYNITSPDINGNGINDIVITEHSASTVLANYTSYFSIGDVFVKGPSGAGKFRDNVYQTMKYYYVDGGTKYEISKTEKLRAFEYSIDFNGDGTFDFVSLDGVNTKLVSNNLLSANPKFIGNIFTGMGKNIEITYCNTGTRFDRSRTSVYQDSYTTYSGALKSFKPENFVVSHVQKDASYPNQIVFDKQYVYQGAVFHKYGKGFLGFEQVTEIDEVTSIGTQSSFTLSTNNFNPSNTLTTAAKFTTFSGGNSGQGAITFWSYNYNAMISERKVAYQHNALGSKRFFIAPQTENSRQFLSSTATQVDYTYDLSKDGSLTQQLSTYGWPGQSPERTEQTDYTYQLVNGIYRPLQTKTTFVQGSNAPYVREANYSFDAAGRLTQVVNDPNLGNQSLVTVYSQFTPFGFPTKINVSSGDILPRESQTLYDPTGRFVIKTINPKGDIEEFTYDPAYGNVLQSKNISGLISKYSYDGLGRLIKSVLPDNTTDYITYQFTGSQNNPNRALFSKTVLNEGQPYMTVEYNHWGQEVRIITEDLQGLTLYSEKVYDNTGLVESSEPHYALGSNQPGYLVNKYTRDGYQRSLKRETFYKTSPTSYTAKGIFTNFSYNTLSTPFSYSKGWTKTVDQNGKAVLQENNASGQATKITNQVSTGSGTMSAAGDLETSDYVYDSNGKPKSVTLSYSNINDVVSHTFSYDALGNQNQLVDPTAGTINYAYNTLGELLHYTDANGDFTYTYDVLGRVTQKVSPVSGTTTYQYVTANAGKNQLAKITGPNVTTELSYDNLGRPLVYQESLPASSKVFISSFEYDAYSRLSTYTYPSSYKIKYIYSANGAGLKAIADDNNTAIWQNAAQDATGHITEYTYGNGITTTQDFGELHNLKSIEHGTLHKQEYVFNPLNGNLTSRTFHNYVSGQSNKEAFNFDPLKRLSKSEQINPANNNAIPNTANNVTIDIKGNILHKDDAGDYLYNNPSLPYGLTQINNPTANIPVNPLGVTINDFRKVNQLTESITGKEMNFTYGNDDERIKVDYLMNTVNQYSRYYQTGYELEESSSNTKEWTYIYSPTGLAAVFYKPSSSANGQLLYALTDHLDSPVMLTDGSQQIQEEYSFDAWGRRRNPSDWSYTGFSAPTILHRGYTMHEHIDEFNLINMNGRVYDAVLGRFTQPDNQVQDPGFLQTFNKYAYVFNNPLSYTDPSGWAGGSAFGTESDGAVLGGLSAAYSNYSDYYAAQNGSGVPWAYPTGGGGGGGGNSWYAAGMATNIKYSAMMDGISGQWSYDSYSETWGVLQQNTSYGQRWLHNSNIDPNADGSLEAEAFEVAYFKGKNRPVEEDGGLTDALFGDGFLATMRKHAGNDNPYMYTNDEMQAQATEVFWAATYLVPVGEVFQGLRLMVNGTRAAEIFAEGSHVVYQGLDAAGNVKYVGITMRDPLVRFAEHLAAEGTGKELLSYYVVEGATGLSKLSARIWEQTLINQYGLIRNGGVLLNRINSIAPKYWALYGIR